ncbi:MAG: AI-2E family transporter [Thermodesulfobacteriota bacterium]|nr:MAG: AI-2E family transporter [Thermodesulfobacteriota bacterium]
MPRKQVFSWFFIAIFLLLLYIFYQILNPFILALFWGAITTLTLYPIHIRLTKLLKNKNSISALIMTIVATFLIILPIVFILATVAVDMFDIYQSLTNNVEVSELKSKLAKLKGLLPVTVLEELQSKLQIEEINVHQMAVKGLSSASTYVINEVQNAATNLTGLLVSFGIMIFSLFFFFRDGESMLERIKSLIPMKDEQKDEIFKKFYDTLNAVIVGVMVTAAIQGLLLGLFFWAIGISYAVLGGVLTFIFALIPIAGAVIVWLPVGLYLVFTSSLYAGIGVLVFGGLVVSSVDNILKPMIIGGKVKLSTLFLVLTIFGSLSVFGFTGIILGPILLAIFMSFIEIYKSEYLESSD